MEPLTSKQQAVLDALLAFAQENGHPPSIQQLCALCGVQSTSTIHHHLTALKKKGFIDWNPSERRAIRLRAGLMGEDVELPGASRPQAIPREEPPAGRLPFLGSIAAGQPIPTLSDAVEILNLSEDLCPPGCYALRVRGTSMIEDHIVDGDIVIVNPQATVRDGDVVVALVEEQTATLKRIYREQAKGETVIRLQPANAEMEPIYAAEVTVQGKVETVIRRVR